MARASSGVINPLFACEIIDLTDESDTTMVAGAIAEQPTHTKTLGVTGKHGEGTMVDKFTLFPKMPIELRLKIWRLSLPGPRVVEVLYREPSRDSLAIQRYGAKETPTTLQVCHESRREALKHYTRTFGGEMWTSEIWFNFSIDTLLVTCDFTGRDSAIDTFLEKAVGLENVRFLAACTGLSWDLADQLDGPGGKWEDLKTITFTDHGEELQSWDCLEIKIGRPRVLEAYILNDLEKWKNARRNRQILYGDLVNAAGGN